MTVYFFITVAVIINIVRARLRGVSDGIGLCKKLLHGISHFCDLNSGLLFRGFCGFLLYTSRIIVL